MVGVTASAETSLHPGAVRPSTGLLMAQVTLPGRSNFTAAVRRLLGLVRVLMPLLLGAGCASWRPTSLIPSDVSQADVGARVLIPPNLNVSPTETVVKPGTPGQASVDQSATLGLGALATTFALPD